MMKNSFGSTLINLTEIITAPHTVNFLSATIFRFRAAAISQLLFAHN